jgi:hypothetical protein
MTMENVHLSVSGASEITLGTAKFIDGNLSGATKLEYLGDPVLKVNHTGVSKINRLNH